MRPAWRVRGRALRVAPRSTRAHRSAVPAAAASPLVGPYSHSIVAGGFDETSYTTRLMPRTSLMMREESLARRS